MSININSLNKCNYRLTWGLESISNPSTYSTIICQRTIRYCLAKKRLKEGQASSLYPKMQNWHENAIVRFPRIPLDSPSPSNVGNLLKEVQVKKQASINKFLIEPALTHISYNNFLKIFQNSLEDTLSFIMSLPEKERGYIIVVDEVQKSNSWMVSLALEQLSVLPPINVVYKGNVNSVLTNKDIRHILLLDDASYSGKQISSTVDVHLFPCLERLKHIKGIHFVIPFMTNRAVERITETIASLPSSYSCFFSSHEKMPLICELPTKGIGVDENDFLIFQEFTHHKQKITPKDSALLALTYFDHKIADKFSIPDAVIKEVVGEVISPYKAEFDAVLDEYNEGNPDSLRIDLLNIDDELRHQFVVIQKSDKFYVYTKSECESLEIIREETSIELQSFEMYELKAGDVLQLDGNIKIYFNGEKVFLE